MPLSALERQHLDQAEHAVLGRHVAGLEGRGHQAVHGGDADEAAAVAALELGPGVLGEQERAGQQQPEQCVPAVGGELGDRRDVLEAGVGDDGVEGPEALDGGRDGVAVARLFGQIGGEGLAGAVRVGLQVDREHLRAAVDQALGHSAPDSRGGTSYDRCPRSEVVAHG